MPKTQELAPFRTPYRIRLEVEYERDGELRTAPLKTVYLDFDEDRAHKFYEGAQNFYKCQGTLLLDGPEEQDCEWCVLN